MNREKLAFEPIVRSGVVDRALIAAVVLCLALQTWLALVMEINWDEFFYLSHIYAYQRGELTNAIQSFHVHVFGWLTSVPEDEISQIIVGRLVMLLCEAGTCVLIYLVARPFASRGAALLAVLAFASASFTIIHGASFRADPIATLLMMAALVVIARARPNLLSTAGAAALAALGAMITVKVVLYAPAFLGIALWRITTAADRRRILVWLAGTAVATAMAFGGLYLVQLGLLPKASNAGVRAGLGNAAETQVGAGFLPRLREIFEFFLLSPLQVLLLVIGAIVAITMLHQRGSRPASVAVLGCGATLLCLLFYRNAFPYFFPFILAPAALLAACAVDRTAIFSRHAVLLGVGLAASAVPVAAAWSSHDQRAQRQLVATVHRMFPHPVAYIDRNSMIGSFPKRGFFMSTWGLQNYHKGPPIFADLLSRETVPLLIANGPALRQATGLVSGVPQDLRLYPQDEEVLRTNYVPHSGAIFVAGKELNAEPAASSFSILIPGSYTVEGGVVMIDERAAMPGAVVSLTRGLHAIRASKPTRVRLRWGNHLFKPPQSVASTPLYRGF